MRKGLLLLVVLVAGLVLGALVAGTARIGGLFGRGADPETIVSASLQSMREQNRLVPFTARYVAVVTSEQRRFGLAARKTLIMPGTVRYELDLARLTPASLAWDRASRTLRVELPPIELAGPEVDLAATREYDQGGVLMALTDAESALDRANRTRGQDALLVQARAPAMMRIARDAAKRAVERSFALPLGAAGMQARVVASFADEAGSPGRSYLDRSRSIEDVLQDGAPRTPANTPSS